MKDSTIAETRGKTRHDKTMKEDDEQNGKVVTRAKRGRPRKIENNGHDESDEAKEEMNGHESNDSHKRTKHLKHIHDAAAQVSVVNEETNGKGSTLEFNELLKQMYKAVPVEEVQDFLEYNGVDTLGSSEEQLYQRSADLLFYGTCHSCPSCGGVLVFSGHAYECSGYSTDWSKCSYSTADGRKGGKPKIWTKLKNAFLKKWVKSHEIAVRQLDPLDKPFLGMTFVLGGRMSSPQGELKNVIESYGGKVVNTPRKGVTAVIAPPEEMSRGGSSKIVEAKHMGIPICREAWLSDSIDKMHPQELDKYTIAGQLTGEGDVIPWDKRSLEEEAALSFAADLKLVGHRGIYKDAQLEDDGGRIFERDGFVYNCALSVCDIHLDLNQYAILQLIEVPLKRKIRGKNGTRTSDIYLYVKEGRVGDRLGVRQRLDHYGSSLSAVERFEKVFEEMTGNEFSSWQLLKTFAKKRNKFFPVDMGPGVDARAGGLDSHSLGISALHSRVDSRVVQFLKILFSQDIYKYALLELGVDAPDLPTGNLSDWHIEFCKEYLVEFSEYLKTGEIDEQTKERASLDFSNKWFTLLHSTRPFIMDDISHLSELAAPTLESVRDISIASRLLGDMSTDGLSDPISDRYAKLECEMIPLDREGDDFKMISNYFQNTMEPLKYSHGVFNVILEDVVRLDSKATPTVEDLEKLSNKKLLWCGMRTCNLVATLHRGMVPALIDAPAAFSSFGKGIYTTDAACKAAQYGFTAVNRPEGFLLLAIVGLGSDMIQLPSPVQPVKEYERERVSVKVLGKKAPNSEGDVSWKDGVTVPCGTLKATNAENIPDYMEFNEYVVYNPQQVKPVFLVKTRFNLVIPEDSTTIAQATDLEK